MAKSAQGEMNPGSGHRGDASPTILGAQQPTFQEIEKGGKPPSRGAYCCVRRASENAITGWWAVLLSPLAIPISILANVLAGKKTTGRTPEDVIGFMSDLMDGSGGIWDWDEFECVAITDPELEAIRQRAVFAGPPEPDVEALQKLIVEVNALIARRAAS